MTSFYRQLHHLLWKILKEGFSLQSLTTKIQTTQKEVCKSHEKYETWILYFSWKYEYNVSSKHFKQAPETDKHKGSSQTKKITINAAIILRLNSTQQWKHWLLTSDTKSHHILHLLDIAIINSSNNLRQIPQSHSQRSGEEIIL